MVDAIDRLGLLHKAISGAEMPGHKYKSRKKVKGSWVYDYGDKKGKPGKRTAEFLSAIRKMVPKGTRAEIHKGVLLLSRPGAGMSYPLPDLEDAKGKDPRTLAYEFKYNNSFDFGPNRHSDADADAEFDALDAQYDITSKGAAPRRAAFEAQVKRLLPGRQVAVTNRSIVVRNGSNSQRYPLIEIFEGSEDMNLRSVAAAFKEMADVDVPKSMSKRAFEREMREHEAFITKERAKEAAATRRSKARPPGSFDRNGRPAGWDPGLR